MNARNHSQSGERELIVATVRVPERPMPAPGVDLLGEVRESAFQDSQWLVRRDGQFLQLTELLYRVLAECNGKQTLEEISQRVTESSEWVVSGELIERIIQTKLLPLGLIDTGQPVGGGPEPRKNPDRGRSALSVNMRMRMLRPQHIDPATRILQHLYAPAVLIPAVLVIALAHIWLYAIHGAGRSIYLTLHTPGLLLVVFVVLLASVAVHEFGHASALRYGGGVVRGMGAGMYLIYPAFYTDTTDSYRLGRWGKVRTDLGGFYFHLLFAVGIITLVAVTGWEFLLLVVVLINVDIVRQLLPFARFDGYWTLVDLTGMPDFFSLMVPFARSVLPGRWGAGSKLPPLRPWVKAVFATYIVVTIPALAALLIFMVIRMPTMLGILGGALTHQGAVLVAAAHAGDVMLALAAALQMLFLGTEVVGLSYMLLMAIVRPVLGFWDRLNPRPLSQRALTGALAAAVALMLFLSSAQRLLTPGATSVLTSPMSPAGSHSRSESSSQASPVARAAVALPGSAMLFRPATSQFFAAERGSSGGEGAAGASPAASSRHDLHAVPASGKEPRRSARRSGMRSHTAHGFRRLPQHRPGSIRGVSTMSEGAGFGQSTPRPAAQAESALGVSAGATSLRPPAAFPSCRRKTVKKRVSHQHR